MYLQLLGLINTVLTLFEGIKAKTLLIYGALEKAFTGNEGMYVLLDGYDHAISLDAISLGAPGSADPIWYYDVSRHLFLPPSFSFSDINLGKKKHIGYLVALINEGENTIHNLDEFIDNLRFLGDTPPTWRHMIAAWSLEKGIIPDKRLSLYVVTGDGDEETLSLDLKKNVI